MNYRIAKFSNGATLKRSSIGRVYSHAYFATGKRPDGSTFAKSGFSASEDQARRNMVTETRWERKTPGYVFELEEVAVCQVIETRKEFEAA